VKRTDIAIALDVSGSMYFGVAAEMLPSALLARTSETIRRAVANMRNPGDVRITDVFYGTTVDVLPDRDATKPVPAAVREAMDDVRRLGGSTALWRACKRTIETLRPRDNVEGNCAMLVLVITDGFDNASRNGEDVWVQQWVQRLQGGGHWTFAYLGIRAAQCLGVFPNERTYPDVQQFDRELQDVLRRFLDVRDTGAQHMDNTFGEVEAAFDTD
jgi:hypothetical protein